MNILPRQKQIEVIAALSEGLGIRATARITCVNRETVGKLALQVGRGCAELHDRLMVGIRVNRSKLDECWSFVAKKQRRIERNEIFAKGDQYVYVGIAGSQKAIISYRVGKRDAENTDRFIRDLRERVIGYPEISTRRISRLQACDPRCLWPSRVSRYDHKDAQCNRPAQGRATALFACGCSSRKP